MRLMCSQNRAEVEAVKNELLKAGIVAETRNNPVAESMGVCGLELWVPEERDFFNASKLLASIQARAGAKANGSVAYLPAPASRLAIRVREPKPQAGERPDRDANGNGSRPASEPRRDELEKASSLLETEIEEMLVRENELARECAALQSRTQGLTQALAEGQAALARETESRAAAESQHAEEVAHLRSVLEAERAEHKRAEEQFGREQLQGQQQLKSIDDALRKAQKELEANSQLLQAQQAAVVDLREELLALGVQRDEQEKLLAQIRAEAAREREARMAAEQRAERAAVAQKSLEKQLLEQKHLEQELRAHVASINSLCSRLHAKRVALVAPVAKP